MQKTGTDPRHGRVESSLSPSPALSHEWTSSLPPRTVIPQLHSRMLEGFSKASSSPSLSPLSPLSLLLEGPPTCSVSSHTVGVLGFVGHTDSVTAVCPPLQCGGSQRREPMNQHGCVPIKLHVRGFRCISVCCDILLFCQFSPPFATANSTPPWETGQRGGGRGFPAGQALPLPPGGSVCLHSSSSGIERILRTVR